MNIIRLKYISALLTFIFIFNISNVRAEERVAERIYVSTDRGSYLAGENLWLSVYCMNLSDSLKLSSLSSVAYVEIQSPASVVLTAKIYLIEGRGSGNILIPPSLATGNYKLVAYTRQMLNEDNPLLFEKIIPIFNVLSTERVPGNVDVVADSVEYNQGLQRTSGFNLSTLGSQGSVEINFGPSGRVLPLNSTVSVTLSNNTGKFSSINMSVVKADSLPYDNKASISNFTRSLKRESVSYNNRYIPEYEGEIIDGSVQTNNGNGKLWDKVIFLSAVGENAEVYSSVIDSTGHFRFYTNSIFGDREIVLEVPSADSNISLTYQINDPFLKKTGGELPKLSLDKNFEKTLNERSIEMQLGRRFRIDTLFEKLPFHNDPLLRTKPVVYKLDDYTRFPVMQEVIIEYITELRFRKLEGRHDLQMRWEDSYKSLAYSRGNTLVLLDGIPVFDHSRIFNYDPLKVKSISIYGAEFFVGYASFEGLVLLNTYKGDYPGLTFNKNARIIDFNGALYPSKFTASTVTKADNFPDMRSLLYWNPQINIETGKSKVIDIHTSSLPGKYYIIIEGITSDGNPVEYSAEFTVK